MGRTKQWLKSTGVHFNWHIFKQFAPYLILLSILQHPSSSMFPSRVAWKKGHVLVPSLSRLSSTPHYHQGPIWNYHPAERGLYPFLYAWVGPFYFLHILSNSLWQSTTMTGIPIARRGSAIIGNLPTPKNKLIVNITLNNEQEDAFVPSFTTLDKIDGIVSIISPFDLNFEDVHITFQGTVRTYVEKVATSASTTGRTQAHHHFLRLFQPIDEAHIPEGRIAKAGQTYQFPFTFVVPERLLPQRTAEPVNTCTMHICNSHLALVILC